MKGQIKLRTIDGWIDKGNGITTIYLNSGIAINVNTTDFIINYSEATKDLSLREDMVKIG